MTEDDAKTKRCCGPQSAAHATYWRGSADVGETPMLCIASACMAWRGASSSPVQNIAFSTIENWQRAGWTVELSEPDVDGTYTATRPQDGYCGLAGRPE